MDRMFGEEQEISDDDEEGYKKRSKDKRRQSPTCATERTSKGTVIRVVYLFLSQFSITLKYAKSEHVGIFNLPKLVYCRYADMHTCSKINENGPIHIWLDMSTLYRIPESS